MMPCKLTSPTFAVTAAVLGALALAVSTCQGAVIDLFDEAPQAIEHTSPSFSQITDRVSLSNSEFETRTLGLGRGNHRLSVNTSGPFLDYQAHGGPFTRNYFEITWSSSSPVDLLASGATAFRVSFLEEATYPRLPMWLEVSSPWERHNTSVTGSIWPGHEHDGTFFFDISFSRYDRVDLTQVDSIVLRGARISEGTSFRLLSITTIPEPTSPVLGSLALLLFLTRRRRLAGKSRPIASSLPRPRG